MRPFGRRFRDGGADDELPSSLERTLSRLHTAHQDGGVANVKAHAAGDLRGWAYNAGVLLGATLAEGVTIEATPVPANLKNAMARPLRLLRSYDAAIRASLQDASTGDLAGFSRVLIGARTLGNLNQALDSVGLRDCGSNQTLSLLSRSD